MSINYANSLSEVGAVTGNAKVVSEAVPAAAAFSMEEDWVKVTKGYKRYSQFKDDSVSIIDENKNITLGKGQITLGQEENSQYIQFEMPRTYDGFDLSGASFSIHVTVNDLEQQEIHFTRTPINFEYSEFLNKIRFGWLIDRAVTHFPGQVVFSIHAETVVYADGEDPLSEGAGLAYTWKTKPCKDIKVEEDLCGVNTECDGDYNFDDESWVQGLIENVAGKIAEEISDESMTGIATRVVNEALDDGNYTQEGENISVFTNDKEYVTSQELEEKGYLVEQDLANGLADYTKTEDLQRDYALKTDIPTIPTNVSVFTNDVGYLTENDLGDYAKTADVAKDYALKTEIPTIPTNVSEFANDAKYATEGFVKDKLGTIAIVKEETDAETGDVIKTEVPVTVKEYVDTAVTNIDISDRLGNIKDAEGEDITVETYVAQEIGKVDVSAQINAKVGDIGESTVKDYVDTAVANVDVTDQLGDYAKTDAVKAMFDEKLGEIVSVSEKVDEETGETVEVKEPITVKEYVDTAVQSVDVKDQLVGLASEEYVESRLGEITPEKTVKQYVDEKVNKIDLSGYATTSALEGVNNNTLTNANDIALAKKDITAIQDSLNSLEGDNKNLIVQYDEVGSLLHLYERREDGDITITDGDEQVKVKEIYSTVITGAGGGTALVSTIKLSLRPDGTASSTILHGTDKELNYTLSTRKARETQDEDGNDVTVYEEAIIAGDITFTLYRDNVYMTHFTVTKDSAEIQSGSVDVSEYVKLGKQVFTITASYNEQLGADGESITVRSSAEWSIDSVKLEITDLPDFAWEAMPKYGNVAFSYTPVGALDKNVYFKIDDREPEIKPDSLNGHTYTYTIPQLSHGVHTLTIWCEGNVGGTVISTEPRKYVLMFVEEGNTDPIIRIKAPETLEQYSSDYIYYNVIDPLNDIVKSVEISDETGTVLSTVENITSAEQKWEFRPSEAKDKTITVKYNEVSESVNIKVTKFPYEINAVTEGLMLDFVPTGRTNADTDAKTFKNNAYTIKKDADTGEEIKEEIPVTWSFSDNFDWVNGGWKADANGDAYFCVKAGTSVDINYNLFGTDGVVANKDANGDYKIAGTGKEFKLIFKTANVAQANATWLECMDVADKRSLGIRMEAQNAYIDSSLGTLEIPYVDDDIIEFDMNIIPMTKFLETGEPDLKAKTIPMVITYEDGTPVQPKVISSASANFKQDNPKPISIGSEYCDVYIYRMKIYDRYLEDKEIITNFIADARTGPEMARRYVRNDIYPIEDKQRITPESVAAACPDLKVYVLSAPYFTQDKKEKVEHTTIRQIHNTGTKENPEYAAEENWTAVDAIHNGQGTSSNEYGYSGRNLEFNMKKATITLNDNVTVVKEIQLSPTSYPTNYLNFKINIASSENANNALLQKRYDRYLPYESIASLIDERKKNSMEFFNCVVFIQETNENIETHREFSDTDIHFYGIGNIGDSKKTDDTRVNDPDDPKEFCVEIMDWNRYLSSFPEDTKFPSLYMDNGEQVLRFEDLLTDNNLGEGGILYEKGPDGQYVHSVDATIDKNKTYYVDILEGDDFSEDYTYGFRYIQDEWDEEDDPNYKELNENFQKPLREKWIEFYRFVTRDLTTNGKEDAEKVKAWKSEFSNWFIVDAALYYYLYTLRYTMVDNRAKNTFWHWAKHYLTLEEALLKGIDVYDENGNQVTDKTSQVTRFYNANGKEIKNINAAAAAINDGYRMEFWAYDNDTALGIDNAGKLEIPFGTEDGDTDAAGVPYFRAHDSTVFVRIAKYFEEELENAWHNTEVNPAGKVFDSTGFINEFDTWQSQFPEELWRLDYERKYKRTYVGGTGSEWDNALPQSNKSDITSDRFLTEMMNGRKKYQRRCFERNQEIYMSSKFKGEVNLGDTITLRGVGQVSADGKVVSPNFAINIIPFSKMYVNLYNATDAIYYHNKCEAGVPCGPIPYPTTNLDFIYVRGASQIQSLGDLSPMYLQTAELTAGAKLKEIVLGNETDGYSNDSLKTLQIGAGNKLLEELDIRNLSNLNNTVLPVSNIPSLKRVYAQGSNITEASFANSGLLEEAYLPGSIIRLELRNLHYLKVMDLESYENLLHLTVVNCSNEMNSLVLNMIKQAPDLKTLRVTNIDWDLSDGSILTRLYGLITDLKAPEVVLSGKISLPLIGTNELLKYNTVWPELKIEPATIIQQFKVTFVNDDGSEIETQYVNQFDAAVAPKDPVKESTVAYSYDFAGWDGALTNITSDRIITATYTPVLRQYKIKYVSYNGAVIPGYEEPILGCYGDNIPYAGEIPTYTGEEPHTYYLFSGWDKSGFLDGDFDENGIKVVTANFEKFSYDATVFETTELEDLTPVQIYALTRQGVKNVNHIIDSEDSITIQLGNDIDYGDVESKVIIGANSVFGDEYTNPLTFDGTTNSYFDTGIELFDEDKDFVIAIDYEFLEGNGNGAVLAQCFENNGRKGWKLSYSSGANLAWGAVSTQTADVSNREMLVLRHVAGENGSKIFVYKSALNADEPVCEILSASQIPVTSTGNSLIFGCSKLVTDNDVYYENNAKGIVHWCKVWYKDLGEAACKDLAEWIHEKVKMKVCSRIDSGGNKLLHGRYSLSDGSGITQLTFVADNLLDRKLRWGEDATNGDNGKNKEAWAGARLAKVLDTRIYNALPVQIKALVKNVDIPMINSSFSDIDYIASYITSPSYREMNFCDDTANVYGAEGTAIDIMGSNAERARTLYEDGEEIAYWLRTPYISNSTGAWTVRGGESSSYDAGSAYQRTTANQYGVLIMFSF